ncbi:hypothetical protein IFM89_014254 [Coptis chinensis]|uniref:DUF7870 domain-containing protein n=1 Tax=Coptis chinensis TaxID=261450 RepID=A0A835IPZ6_9MAGN|nr:hypothetical protein IFM89_014254 [Coptis chinensis]
MDIQVKKQKYTPRSVMYENQLVITIPNSRVMKVIARSILLALIIVTFPFIESFIQDSRDRSLVVENGLSFNPIDSVLLPLIFQDLIHEGLFKLGDKALFVSSGFYNLNDYENRNILIDNGIDLVSEADQERLSSIPDGSFDFVISSALHASEFVDRSLKIGGIALVQLNTDPSNAFEKPSNYKIVYVRKFDSTIVALRKISDYEKSPAKRRLCSFQSEAKMAALDGLEDVILEPPRGSSSVFKKYSRKTKYLPELTGDSLDGYSRRVFIDVTLPGKSEGSIEWFKENYPTRNRVFDIFNIEMVPEESTMPQIGVSDWLRKNVKKEEYVVMKAEAEVVEEMISSKAICLVDELFLECKHQWQRGKKTRAEGLIGNV